MIVSTLVSSFCSPRMAAKASSKLEEPVSVTDQGNLIFLQRFLFPVNSGTNTTNKAKLRVTVRVNSES